MLSLNDITVKTPIDVPTRETVTFLASYLHCGAEILEVGCGEGHVASELSRRGYRLIGVDSDHDVIAQAQRRGIRAIVASWPEFDRPPVDAIAFTRSLHHINPLRKAVGRARELVRPKGLLFLEDFAFDEANKTTVQWFLDVLRSQRGAALINPVAGEFVTELLRSKDAEGVWHQSHDHGLHSMTAISRAIAEYFTVREMRSVPYLYRYLVPVLAETSAAAAFVEEVFREEAHLGERGNIVLVGRRIVGSR